jgi:hypothetical protein
MVVANLDKMNRYGFGTGVEGMAKMAAKAAAMRVDMGQTLAVADKLFSPEAAIDVAASLQRLGATSGALLDPLKLMDLAQNNVPELQNQLSELSKTFTKFDKDTGQFQIMPQARQQLKEVADALGIDRAEFEKMAIESAKIEKKLGEINFGGLKATDDQKMMLANMAEFNKSTGSYEVTVKDKQGNLVQQSLEKLTDDQLKEIKARQELEKKDSGLQLVDLAKEQLLASQQLVSEQKALGSLLTTQYAIGKTGNDFLTNAINTQNNTFRKTYEDLSLKKGGGEGVLGELQQFVNKALKEGTFPTEAEMYQSLQNIMSKFSGIVADNEERLKSADSLTSAYSNIKLVTAGFTLVTDITTKFSEAAKGATGDLTGVQKSAALLIPLFKEGYDYLMNNKNKTQTVTPTAPTNSTTVPTGNNNSTSQTSSSNTNSPAGNNNATLTAQVNKIEHKIELTVKTDINNTEVAAAVTKAFSNDDTLRELRTAIATVASDYGLTTT